MRYPLLALSLLAVAGSLCSCSLVSETPQVQAAGRQQLSNRQSAPAIVIEAAAAPAPVLPAVPALQTQPGGKAGVALDLTECSRRDGILTVKLRVRNAGSQNVGLGFPWNLEADNLYLIAAGKKYFLLKDSAGVPIERGDLLGSVDPGGVKTWWGKFPAPPSEVRQVSLLVLPEATPFEDFPISGR